MSEAHKKKIAAALAAKPDPEKRICTRCLVEKTVGVDFGWRQSTVNQRPRSWCKECECDYRKEKYDPVRQGVHNRRNAFKKHGITEEIFNEMLEDQGGICAICSNEQQSTRSDRLFIDHDHSTGTVRGLLCSNCNAGLGHFMDDPTSLQAAISYLRRPVFQPSSES